MATFGEIELFKNSSPFVISGTFIGTRRNHFDVDWYPGVYEPFDVERVHTEPLIFALQNPHDSNGHLKDNKVPIMYQKYV